MKSQEMELNRPFLVIQIPFSFLRSLLESNFETTLKCREMPFRKHVGASSWQP